MTAPGTIIEVGRDSLQVATGEGILVLEAVQLEGKKKMSVHDFLLGNKVEKGQIMTEGKEE